ncbi:copper transporter [Corynebacterium wankanglinii]|uniref:Copper transporter n=1 Tax=Corynebacterium wankanglinii TaxID=2735136 RepID=A0A838CM95_9CORY|nr:copper transporter [Corynebacterium wankanglinii]MBA1836077.1 copper transporter [Corynebacterium wankanglinii]
MAKTKGRAGLIAAGLGWGLALGVALGALVLAPAMPGSVDLGFSEFKPEAKSNVDEEALAAAEARAEEADDLLAQESGSIVSGALKDVAVTIVRTAEADADDVESVRWLLNAAGASDSGELTLTERFTDQAGADELSTIVANTLPSGAQLSVQDRSPGTHAGESLAAVLLSDGASGESKTSPEDRTLVLETLQQAGFIKFSGSLVPAEAIVIVDGPERSGEFSAKLVSDFAKAIGAQGRTALATQGARPALIDGVKVVGGVDREAGRIKTVLAVSSGAPEM